MTSLQIILLLCIATLTGRVTFYIAPAIADREAAKSWSERSVDEDRSQPAPPIGASEFRDLAEDSAIRNGWLVWAISLLLGSGVGLLMGRGGLHIGEPSVEQGEVGCAFFLVKILLIILVLGVARLLARFFGRTIAVGYAAGMTGVIVGVLLAIPISFLLRLFAPAGAIRTIEVSIGMRVMLFCGTMTIAAVAAVVAPMVTPVLRTGEVAGAMAGASRR